MAYWDSYSGENYQNPFDYNYGISNFNHIYQSSPTYNDSICYNPQSSGFDPMNYYCNYTSGTSSESVGYSVFTLSEPKHVVYDPNCYNVYEIVNPSEFKISYSVYEFNETDFEEYDPTPYGGGYDISATYGEALPPSDKTCYPCSSIDPTKLPTLPSIPLGSVGDSHENEKNTIGFASVPVKETLPIQAIHDDDDDDDDDDGFISDQDNETKPIEAIQETKEEDDRSSYESERLENVKVRYIPSGYGLEAMDLCETIFGGYFPCLLNKQKRDDDDNDNNRVSVTCCERNESDPWKRTSDYLFGDPQVYENHGGISHSEMFYGYEWRQLD